MSAPSPVNSKSADRNSVPSGNSQIKQSSPAGVGGWPSVISTWHDDKVVLEAGKPEATKFMIRTFVANFFKKFESVDFRSTSF